jgi:hypothetical protein
MFVVVFIFTILAWIFSFLTNVKQCIIPKIVVVSADGWFIFGLFVEWFIVGLPVWTSSQLADPPFFVEVIPIVIVIVIFNGCSVSDWLWF